MEERVPQPEEEEGEDEVGSEEEGDKDEDEQVVMPLASDKTEENIPLTAQCKEKKQADVLNLNNEVVKMRKEVKRVRALIIRKLTRQIGALKKKKGNEMEIERNHRRAGRLLEDIHAMKGLIPDLVTKTALQKNLNFDQVCKNPKSSISDRAIARIATHPHFSKKIEDIKAGVKAFKEERMKGRKQGGKEKVQNQIGKVNPRSPERSGDRKSEKEEEEHTVEQKNVVDNEEGDAIGKDTKDATVVEYERETGKETQSAYTAHVQKKDMPKSKSVKPVSLKSSQVNDVKDKPQSKDGEKKPNFSPAPPFQKRSHDEESDLESSDDEEKEYFDDSTEERFHKQSSHSEESDDDDFFIGKVSKFKKKKKQKSIEGEEEGEKNYDVRKDSPEKGKTSDKVQSELDELRSRLKSKATSLQSVFCSSLSGSKHSRGGVAGRGRGVDKFRSQGKPKGGSGLTRDFSKQPKFAKQGKGKEGISGSGYSKHCPEVRHPEMEEKSSAFVGRGRGQSRGDVTVHKDHRGKGMFSHQALHPSWEASKRRKAQQGQILAFQGKKIKFDDDDD